MDGAGGLQGWYLVALSPGKIGYSGEDAEPSRDWDSRGP